MNKKTVDYSHIVNEIKTFEESLYFDNENITNYNDNIDHYKSIYDTIALFQFDPNTIDIDTWRKLGVSNKQITTIQNYINKGGRFRQPDDLSKIYGLNQYQVEKLRPYIKINSINEGQTYYTNNNDKVEHEEFDINVVELNTADTFDLMSLIGIGPVYALRIIKYRDLLGGFHNEQQLLEVYNFKLDILNGISEHITIDSTKIRKLDLNSSTYKQLIRHPYLNGYDVKSILLYRDHTGEIKSPKELLINNIIDLETYQRLKPYLVVK